MQQLKIKGSEASLLAIGQTTSLLSERLRHMENLLDQYGNIMTKGLREAISETIEFANQTSKELMAAANAKMFGDLSDEGFRKKVEQKDEELVAIANDVLLVEIDKYENLNYMTQNEDKPEVVREFKRQGRFIRRFSYAKYMDASADIRDADLNEIIESHSLGAWGHTFRIADWKNPLVKKALVDETVRQYESQLDSLHQQLEEAQITTEQDAYQALEKKVYDGYQDIAELYMDELAPSMVKTVCDACGVSLSSGLATEIEAHAEQTVMRTLSLVQNQVSQESAEKVLETYMSQYSLDF